MNFEAANRFGLTVAIVALGVSVVWAGLGTTEPEIIRSLIANPNLCVSAGAAAVGIAALAVAHRRRNRQRTTALLWVLVTVCWVFAWFDPPTKGDHSLASDLNSLALVGCSVSVANDGSIVRRPALVPAICFLVYLVAIVIVRFCVRIDLEQMGNERLDWNVSMAVATAAPLILAFSLPRGDSMSRVLPGYLIVYSLLQVVAYSLLKNSRVQELGYAMAALASLKGGISVWIAIYCMRANSEQRKRWHEYWVAGMATVVPAMLNIFPPS